MTPAQSLRLRGFNASLAQRGVFVRLADADDAAEFKVLLEHASASLDGFELGSAQRHSGTLHMLRSEFVKWDGMREQAVFESRTPTESWEVARQWSVTRIEDNPANILVLIHCVLDGEVGEE